MKVSTQLKRYYRWRYSGPITVISVFAIGILGWHFGTSNIEFFDKFTCPQIMEYKGGDYGVKEMPKYSQLNEIQKERFDIAFSECLQLGWKAK